MKEREALYCSATFAGETFPRYRIRSSLCELDRSIDRSNTMLNDIKIFYDEIKDLNGQNIEKNGGTFEISEEFQDYIKSLIGKETDILLS